MQRFAKVHESLSGRRGQRPDRDAQFNLGIDQSNTFSVENYTSRTRINLQAEPYLFENQIMLRNGRKKDFEIFLNKLKEVLTFCNEGGCQAYILIIPQCCQINDRYLRNMEFVGAKFNNSSEIHRDEYPFIVKTREALANKYNVLVLNPMHALKEEEEKGKFMYFQNDEHLTQDGQVAITEFLLSHLKLN